MAQMTQARKHPWLTLSARKRDQACSASGEHATRQRLLSERGST